MLFFDRLAELERRHATFAVATVVGRQAPVSSHLGDRALVFPDGRMEGFVGGSCSRDIVRRVGLETIATALPRLLHIRPSIDIAETRDDGEHVFVPMGCASEGAVDIYIEPHVPLRRLVVVGFTPVADAIARIAASLEYAVARAVEEEELRDVAPVAGVETFVLGELDRYLDELGALELGRLVAVVASQGHYDEAALGMLLRRDVAYLGLVGSRKRASVVFGVLRQSGVDGALLERVRNPAGLDISARTPGEIAVSILSEVISTSVPRANAKPCREAEARFAGDPVCGMDVEIVTARHRVERAGTMRYFCCAGCAATFAADPARFEHAAVSNA